VFTPSLVSSLSPSFFIITFLTLIIVYHRLSSFIIVLVTLLIFFVTLHHSETLQLQTSHGVGTIRARRTSWTGPVQPLSPFRLLHPVSGSWKSENSSHRTSSRFNHAARCSVMGGSDQQEIAQIGGNKLALHSRKSELISDNGL